MHTYTGLWSVISIRFWIVNQFKNCLLMLLKMSDTVLHFVDPDNEHARQQLIDIRQKMGVTSIFRIWFILIVDVVWRLLIMFKHLNVQFPP